MKFQEIPVFFFLLMGSFSMGQTLHHQTLGSQGNTVVLKSGAVLSQSIGQQGIVGNGIIGDAHIIQGFQQSNRAIRFITAGLPNSGDVNASPNPFSDLLNFEFSTMVSGPVRISVFDSAGRLVIIKEVTAIDNKAQVTLANLQSGVYHLTLENNQKTFYTTVIRK